MTPLKTVTIHYHSEADGWWADSPQLPGWTAVGATFEELRDLAIEGAAEFAGPGFAITELVPQLDPGSSVLRQLFSTGEALLTGTYLSFSVSTVPSLECSPSRIAPHEVTEPTLTLKAS